MNKLTGIIILLFITESCKVLTPVESTRLPAPDHIVVVFFENYSFHQILDSTEAPYIKSLAYGDHSALFTNSNAFGHPSQPNYFEFFSGYNQGILTNDHPDTSFTTPNLAYSLIQKGYTFTTFSEGLPYAGFDGDIDGYYVRKHNPAANWMGYGEYQIDSSTNQPLTSFPDNFDDLPTVSFIIPDLINSMHDGTIKTGDEWLKEHLHQYIKWAKKNNSLFIFTFDESSYVSGNNIIPTFIIGKNVKAGIYTDYIDHHSILRTLEDMYALPYAGNEVYSLPITNCWRFEF